MLSKVLEKRLIPVAVIDNAEDAVPLAQALLAGGLSVIEVTLRTDAAIASMQAIKRSVPEMLVGAGTILEESYIPELVGMGVNFGISPGINTNVIETAEKYQFPIMPGVITPSEIEQARNYALETLKFFPAEAAGGVTMLKALAGPYAHTGIQFVPTGGINAANMTDYLKVASVAAIGGSWFVAKEFLAEKKFDAISELTREALGIINDIQT